MILEKIPFNQIPYLSKRDIAYTTKQKNLSPFYKYDVNIKSFKDVIRDKQKDLINREVLVNALNLQYEGLQVSAVLEKNIQSLLDKKTFTITTAHQPSLFTGPLYFIYKIISTINLVKQLNEYYPHFHFVPVFITGGEDHDFEEVNHFNLFNKKYIWESGENGAVGRMQTQKILPVLQELKTTLGDSENALSIYKLLENAHTQHELYADSIIHLVNDLFGEDGLIVLNPAVPVLKALFIPHIKKEIFKQISKPLISKTQTELQEAGFKAQAFVRDINFFYLGEQYRERIVQEGEQYKVLGQNLTFTSTEMEAEIENHPEKFSPNVVMRPLFQEVILPNLAYIGGGGEIAYWLERKTQFEAFGVNFPMLMRRDSVLWIDKNMYKKINQLEFSIQTIFNNTDPLIKDFIHQQAHESLELNVEKGQLESIFKNIQKKVQNIDQSLEKTVLAEATKQLKSLGYLEHKLLKAEKQKQEVQLNKIRNLKQKLFPNEGLQERHDNFLGFYLKYGKEYFTILKQFLNPLDTTFKVIVEK